MERKKWTQDEVDAMINLHGMWLRGVEGGKKAEVQNADFYGTNFMGVDISEGWFCDCSFTGLDMSGMVAKGTTFITSAFLGATMKDANIDCAVFRECTFDNTDCTNANLMNTRFIYHKQGSKEEPKIEDGTIYSLYSYHAKYNMFAGADSDKLREVGIKCTGEQ